MIIPPVVPIRWLLAFIPPAQLFLRQSKCMFEGRPIDSCTRRGDKAVQQSGSSIRMRYTRDFKDCGGWFVYRCRLRQLACVS